MADPKESQVQLDLQLQINKVLQERQTILAAQQKSLSSQVQIAVDLCKALKCEELDKVEERLKTNRDEMQKAAEEAGRLGNALNAVGQNGVKAGESASSSMSSLGKQLTTGKMATVGFGAGILQFGGIFIQTFKNVLSMVAGLVSSLAKIGFAIFTLPFKLLGGLIS